jgi:5-(carboxyamino)imidazole ribonucleotide synthase
VLGEPRASLYLYGKKEARPGRKMGHFTVVDPDAGAALEAALRLRQRLGIGNA